MAKATTRTSRDLLRSKIFSGNKPEEVTFEFMGGEITMRQMTIGDILQIQEIGGGREGLTYTLINHCYVPGTNERVFEDSDKDNLLALPADNDSLEALNSAVAKLTGIDIADAEGNLNATA